jgi:hypothetical protein
MAFFDTFSNPFEGMNIFGAKIPTYLSGTPASEGVDATKGLLTQPEIDKLKNQALFQGLLGTAATYLAQPKNQNYGSALPYLAKSFLGGMQGSQGAYDQATQNLITKGKLSEAQREAETAATIKDTQTSLMADERVKSNPVLKALVAKGQFDKVSEYLTPKSTFGTGLEGASLNILAKGSINTKEAEDLRKTPEYALAYNNRTQDRTVMQETMDANGNTYTVPVTIKAQPLPKSILPPIYGEQDVTTQAVDLTQPQISTKPGQVTQTTPLTSQPTQQPIIKKVGQTSQDIFKQEQDLRKQYQDTPEVKNFGEVRSAFNIINTSLSNASPAGDLAGATKFMKLLDPNSVVRDTELQLAMNATGVVDKAQNYFNMLATGQKLNPTQRQDFKDVAVKLYKAAEDVKNKYDVQYADIAKSNKLNPSKVIMGWKDKTPSSQVRNKDDILKAYGVE